MRPITLAGFDAKFADSDDPWQTFDGPDEILKRKAILHAMGPGPWGRVLELAAGNGSNSAAIAPRALRLDATEATESGTALVKKAVESRRGGLRAGRTRVLKLAVPARLPRQRYDGVVVAELLYYLTPLAMRRTACDVARAIRPGGVLVLAHHRIDFPDFAQHAAILQRRFLKETRQGWHVRTVRRTSHWVVVSCRRGR